MNNKEKKIMKLKKIILSKNKLTFNKLTKKKKKHIKYEGIIALISDLNN